VLLDIDPVPQDGGWAEYSVALPGPGRIALRYYLTNAGPGSQRGGFFGVDTLSVGEPVDGEFPIPEPGETVHWTTAMSPIVMNGNVVIPAGGTVIIDPGVEVRATANSTLVVQGVVRGEGTAEDRVRFTQTTSYPPIISVDRGVLECRFTEFDGHIRPEAAGTIILRDSDFFGRGGMFNQYVLMDKLFFVDLERVTISGGNDLIFSDGWVRLKDVTGTDAEIWCVGGFAVTENVNLTGGKFAVYTNQYDQPRYVDGVTVTGVPDAAGLDLVGTNFLLGPDVVSQGNFFPLFINDGLMPGSQITSIGNTWDAVGIWDHFGGRQYWPKLDIPYAFLGNAVVDAYIEPGVTIKMDYDAGFRGYINSEGTPEAPITIEKLVPQGWAGATDFRVPIGIWPYDARFESTILRDTVEEAAVSGSFVTYNDCIVENNAVGLNDLGFGVGLLTVRKTQFLNNTNGLEGHADLTGETNPNSFEGNAAAIYANNAPDAPYNWWGHPTGPQAPQNPDGQGDPIVGPNASAVQIFPFLTAEPDFADHPPVVRVQDTFFVLQPGYDLASPTIVAGDKYIVRWDSSDELPIVKHRVILERDGHSDVLIADDLPGTQQSFEWTAPPSGANRIRVEALDAAGQVGWDEVAVRVLPQNSYGEISIEEDFTGMTFIGADEFLPELHITGATDDYWDFQVVLLLEADGQQIDAYTNWQYGYADFITPLPIVSTDAARLAIIGTNKDHAPAWFFESGYFSIRLDPRLGLTPPEVELQTPRAGETFSGGGVAPITWTASDADDGLYSFDIQVSYDGGRTWKALVEKLPPEARRYDWRLPPSDGLADVRVRVIARDVQFQNSTSGHDRSFAIVPGDGCAADFNGDDAVNTLDVLAFLNAWSGRDPRADFNRDGAINTQDVLAFLNAWTAGC